MFYIVNGEFFNSSEHNHLWPAISNTVNVKLSKNNLVNFLVT